VRACRETSGETTAVRFAVRWTTVSMILYATAVYGTGTVASFHFRFLLYLALDLNLLPFAFLASGLSSRPSEKLPRFFPP